MKRRSELDASGAKSLLCLVLLLPVPATGQTTGDARRTPATIENIVVTTDRRAEHAQDVGAAISVFSLEDLERQNIQTIYDLQLSVPSLVATGGLPNLTLRGIGNDIVAQGIDPGFALHTNGVYATQMASALLDFYDLERVEVLYGPQGTLFGRSTTGGTVNFITKRPTQDVELVADAEWASFEKLRLRSTVNLPLVEGKLGARLNWAHEWQAKPFKARGANGLDQEFGNNTTGQGDTARLALAWTPTESFRADGLFSWSRDNTAGGTVRYLGDYPAYPAGQHALFGSIVGSPDYTAATPNSGDALRPRLNWRKSQRMEVAFGQLMLEWQLGDFLLKSNSAYQYWDYRTLRDQDSSDVDAEHLQLKDKDISWTQELTVQSASASRFQWLLGANYQHVNTQTLASTSDLQADADAANFAIIDATTFALADRCVGGVCDSAPLDGRPQVQLDGHTVTKVFGGFGNVWFELTEQIRLSGGLRYSYTHRDFDDRSTLDAYSEAFDAIDDDTCPDLGLPLDREPCFALLAGAVPAPATGPLTPANTAFLTPFRGDRVFDAGDGSAFNSMPTDKEKSWNSVTGHVRVEYKPLDETLLYASVAKGERHGGFNWLGSLGAGLVSGFDESFDSEEILAYEVGTKNFFFDRRLMLNVSAFYYDYDEKFIQQQINNIAATVNAPSAEVFGLELVWIALPTPKLRLNGSFSWLDAKFDEDFFSQDASLGPDNPTGFSSTSLPGEQHGAGPDAQGRPPENLNGNPLRQSPRYSLSLGAEYAFDLGEHGRLTPRIDFAWRDAVYYQEFRDGKDRQSAFHRTDLRLRWESAGERWWLEGFVQNLENEKEIKTNLESANRHRQWYLAPPRQLGIRAGFRFSR